MDKNVALIVMDTARASDTDFVREELPNSSLAQLAGEGTEYLNTFSNSPWTLPSHTSMFTGTYTSKHGTHAGHKFYEGQFPTIADLLSNAGYETVGITNNAWVTDEFGLGRGFNQLYKMWQYIQTDTDFGEIQLTTDGVDRLKKGLSELFSDDIFANLINSIYGKFLYRRSDYGAARTNKFVERWLSSRDNDQPFFLFVNYLEPHLDYQPSREFADRFLSVGSYDEAMNVPQMPWEYVAGSLEMSARDFELLQGLYRAEIAYLDQQIGELRAKFEKYGEWEDTVFIVVGDHGENIGDHGLMDHQYSVHDTLIHVPLLIEGGKFSGGGESSDLVQLVDLYPTILDCAGVSIPNHAQGYSLSPDSSSPPREYILAEYLSLLPEIDRLSEQTGIPNEQLQQFDRSLRTVRTEEFKFVRGSDGSKKLFNVINDGEEEKNIINSNQQIAEDLEAELDMWLASFDHSSTQGKTEMSTSTKQKLEDLGYLQ